MHKLLLLTVMLSFSALQCTYGQKYKDLSLDIEERTQDLLGRMTLEEKVGQLLCPLGWEMYKKEGNTVTYSDKFEDFVQKRHIGMLWAVYRADPWTKKTLDNGLTPELAAQAGNALQRYVVENTRLGIPLFLAEEFPHGHMAIGTTVFPTGIGLASSFSASLMEEIGRVKSKEVRLQGGHIGYGPVLDLARDPRWSRVEETMGEDPVLAARLGASTVKGAGGADLQKRYSVISTLKHFLAYGIPEGGHNGNATLTGPRDLQENFLPPFEAAIRAGALSVMTSYNSIDGVPSTSNKHLLSETLRKELNFKGFVVSDLGSIQGLNGAHHIAENLEEAAILASEAGVDSDLGGEAYLKLIDAVKNGRIEASLIDSSVCRILRLKFRMGLFENPYVDPVEAKEQVRSPEHIAVARQAAQKSIVLLKNNNSILPLSKSVKNIAVIGPNADNMYNMLGDYTAPQDPENVVTILEGIRAKNTPTEITYVKGCAIRDTLNTNIDQAVAVAKKADVTVVVVGGSSARDFKTKYQETGAAITSEDNVSDMESGEGFDRATLDLMGKQIELLKALKATGKPLIVIYIQGRPLKMNWASENADALLTAWYPGQEGGNAIADVLFGDYNPAGRLPISVPRHVGQLPVHYNKMRPKGHDYVEIEASPLYPFGFGLSYTGFKYENLKVSKQGEHVFEVSFTIKNTGKLDGEEVAQLYIRDEYASTVRPVKQLRHFQRVFIPKGKEKRITFEITEDDLSLIDRHMRKIVEPGDFTIMIGASSDDVRLQTRLQVE